MKLPKCQNHSTKPVVVIALVTALCLIGDSMLYIALPIYFKEVGLQSLWEVGLLLSLNRFIRIPINPLVGWMYRKLSLRTGIIISVLLAAITTVGYALSSGLLIWMVLRMLWGIAWSFLRLGGLFTVMECSTEKNRGRLMGTYNGLYRLGYLVGMLAGGILVSIVGLTFVSISFGLVMLIGIPLVVYLIPGEKVEEKEEKQIERLSKVLTTPIIFTILSGLLLAFIFQGMFVSTITLLLSSHFGEEISMFGVTLGVTALAGIIQGVRWLWEPYISIKVGHYSDGVQGRIPIFIMFLLLASISIIVIPFYLPIYVWLMISLLFMGTGTVLTTLIDTIASDVAKTSDTNTVITYYTVGIDIGAALGPLVVFLFLSLDNGTFLAYSLGSFLLFVLALLWYHSLSPKSHLTLKRCH